MKRKISIVLVVVLVISVGLTLMNCATFPVEPLPLGGSEAKITGTWELKPSGNQYPQVFYFEENGSWTRQNIGEVPQTGYYSFDGTDLKLVSKYFSVTATANISENTLTIKYPDNKNYWVYNKKPDSN